MIDRAHECIHRKKLTNEIGLEPMNEMFKEIYIIKQWVHYPACMLYS